MTVPTSPPHGAGAPSGASEAVGTASATAARDARLTWIIGGSLLIAFAVFPLITQGMPVMGFGFVSSLLWAGALVVFAVGVRGQGSVVARRPLGVTALVIAGLIPIATTLFWSVVPIEAFPAPGSAVLVSQAIGVLSLAALLVATVQIARAGVVAPRVRWLPLILLVVSAAPHAALQAAAVSGPNTDQVLLLTMIFAATAVSTLAALALGIMSIVLAPRSDVAKADVSVQVFPPAS